MAFVRIENLEIEPFSVVLDIHRHHIFFDLHHDKEIISFGMACSVRNRFLHEG